ncbi:hypothetical protein IJ00_23170 [Calothrix sp. 336/3]|nr:hypothetical protein IJ00_23170 [Calothrix sp. 336/3]
MYLISIISELSRKLNIIAIAHMKFWRYTQKQNAYSATVCTQQKQYVIKYTSSKDNANIKQN